MKFCLLIIVILFVNVDGDDQTHSKRSHHRRFFRHFKDHVKHQSDGKFSFDFRHFDKEEMILFPDIAFQSIDSPDIWNVLVHGWRYEGSRRKDWLGFSASKWIERIASHFASKEDILYLNGSINRDRLRPFFVEDESNEAIQILLGSKKHILRTDRQGEFYEELLTSNDEVQQLKLNSELPSCLIYEAIGDNNDKVKGIIRLIEPMEGISVVSDIDDTIKISEVLDKLRLLANTFIHPFKAVPGMADLYRNWNSKHSNMTFHYLSGMPDQLFTLTHEFIADNNFPDGSYHMRHFAWAATSIFHFLHSESTMNHKLSYLRFFLGNTKRDYVLVGDSGEKDPEIYGIIAREYPQRVRAIFIRAIKGEAFNDDRFLRVFQGVPDEKWQIFNDPQKLPLDLTKPPRSNITSV